MPLPSVQDTLENVLGAVGDCLDAPSAKALLGLRAPADLQQRIEALAERNTAGELTAHEREEYEALVRVGNFVAILQARARRQLTGGQAA